MLSRKYPVCTIACIAFLLALSLSSAFAADASERRFIRQGMSEGDVLMKIGKPDSESADTSGGATVITKRWVYLPTAGDEQMLTTVVLESGKVIQVIRQVAY
jgi:hypothetical protein